MDVRTKDWLKQRLWEAGDDIEKLKDIVRDLIDELPNDEPKE